MRAAGSNGCLGAAPVSYGSQWALTMDGGECATGCIVRLGDRPGGPVFLPPNPGTYACLVALDANGSYTLSNGHGDGAVTYGGHTSVRVCDLRWGWIVDAADTQLDLFVFRFTVTALLRACDAPITALTAAEDLQGHMRTDRILNELALAISEAVAMPAGCASHLMRAFLLELGHVYPQLGKERTGTTEQLAPWQLLRATEFIRDRLAGKATVGEIAGVCGLSTSYFSRLFKNTTGMTTHQWIVEQRLEHARSLLVSTAMTLVDIAYACGFADQTHFTRVFSRKMNASPMAWRRQRLCCQKDAVPAPSDVRKAG